MTFTVKSPSLARRLAAAVALAAIATGSSATAQITEVQTEELSFSVGDSPSQSACDGVVRIAAWADSNATDDSSGNTPERYFKLVKLTNAHIYSRLPAISWPSHTLSFELKPDTPAGIVSEVAAVLTGFDGDDDGQLITSPPQQWTISTEACNEGDSSADALANSDDTSPPAEPQPEPEPPRYSSTLNTSPPAGGTTYVSSMSPIGSTNGPLCLRPAIDSTGQPLMNERGNCPVVLYHPNLAFGDFILASNAWNFCASTLPDWEQCISVDSIAGNVTPRWTYDWGNESDVNGEVWLVKSYPEIIYGVKSPGEYSGSSLLETPAETGLPARVDSMPFYQFTYTFSSDHDTTRSKEHDGQTVHGERNIAVESFFHELDGECDVNSLVRNGRDSNQRFEIMLWLDRGPERLPSGSRDFVTSIELDGKGYDVYTKPSDPEYIAFVAQQPTTSGQINWSTFIEWSRTYSHQLAESFGRGSNTVKIEDDWCMANILLGTEIWWGSGYFQADEWTIQRTLAPIAPLLVDPPGNDLPATGPATETPLAEPDPVEPFAIQNDSVPTGDIILRTQTSGCTLGGSGFDTTFYLLALLALGGLRRARKAASS